MRIKEVNCKQFAGLRKREFVFENGLNLIIGDNESGKSTLVDLLYHLFFQDAFLDGRRDKDFKEKYFPKSAGALQADFIAGEIRFETDKGTYTLSKKWSCRNGTVELEMPNEYSIEDPEAVRDEVSKALEYGKGVYDELVFASQRRPQTILRGLLAGEESGNMKELSAAVSKAVMEIGGIAVDEMEAALRENVSSYEGKWDFAADMPEGGRKRGINNRWKNGAGSIVNAYYAMEEIAAALEAAEEAERRVDGVNADIRAAKQELDRLTSLRERFSSIRSLLSAQTANRQLLQNAEEALQTMQSVLSVWPSQVEQTLKAKRLKEQLQQAKIRELYETVSGLINSRDTTSDALDRIGTILQTDVDAAVSLEDKIRRLESILRGMNLTARIRKLGETEVLVTSAASGDALTSDNDEIDITEAVDIRVPGVVEIQLAPKGVDVDSVRTELAKARKELEAVLDHYGVSSADDLKNKRQKANDLVRDLDDVNKKINSALGEKTWEELHNEVASIPADINSSDELIAEIASLCGRDSIDAFIGRLETLIGGHVTKYGSIAALSASVEEKKAEVINLKAKTEIAEAIPEEFREVSDPDQYDKRLKASVDETQSQIIELNDALSKAERALTDQSAEEYAEEYLRAKATFDELKTEYFRWKHILDVFITIKNHAKGNPLADVETYFRGYLSTISQGKLVLNEIGDDLGSAIASGNNRLTADILSDGTKDTIALAFRLAVLKHLFPEGGCVAVFDDPFTDMDPTRTEQACRLIQEFAENNQVIFVSCDDKYKKLLTGNIINITG